MMNVTWFLTAVGYLWLIKSLAEETYKQLNIIQYGDCYERRRFGLFLSDRGGAGHRLGGRGRLGDFLEEAKAKMGPKGKKDLCGWRIGGKLFQVERVAYVNTPRGELF